MTCNIRTYTPSHAHMYSVRRTVYFVHTHMYIHTPTSTRAYTHTHTHTPTRTLMSVNMRITKNDNPN